MKNKLLLALFALGAGAVLLFLSCKEKVNSKTATTPENTEKIVQLSDSLPQLKVAVEETIRIKGFFQYLDKVIQQYDTSQAFKLTENLLLRANPWLLDTLEHTDYYHQMALGNFIYDQKEMIVLKPGDTLVIPDAANANMLLDKMAKTTLEVNIPAFTLKIKENDVVLREIKVRVGKHQKKYLEMAVRTVDLRTHTGEGEIVRVNRYPAFYDPVTGKKFKYTKRDDYNTTFMPQIPWLEPAINGHRYGQMIHPTTNPRTLGKTTSNGCIGVGEADGWAIYFYAPTGTKVRILYELMEIKAQGDTLHYEDVYKLRHNRNSSASILSAAFFSNDAKNICLCDSLF